MRQPVKFVDVDQAHDIADLISKYNECVMQYGSGTVASTLARYKRLARKRQQYQLNLARVDAMIKQLTVPHSNY